MFLAPEEPDVYRHNHQTKRLSSGGAKCYISSLWDRAKPSSKKLEVRALSLRDPEIMADVKGVSLSINLDRTFLSQYPASLCASASQWQNFVSPALSARVRRPRSARSPSCSGDRWGNRAACTVRNPVAGAKSLPVAKTVA